MITGNKETELPLHIVPFPENPGLQVQMYEEIVFSQVALMWQPSLLLEHSSKSNKSA